MLIKREILKNLKKHLSKKEISFIIGPRQAGKTTLMFILKKYLERKKKKTLFLSLDIEADQPFFVSQKALVDKIQLEIGKEKGYVFIDEIQRKENAGLFLKGLYDLNLPYKFIISGSGSVELKEKIHESLIGRKRVFELNTLSFREFVNFKTNYRYQKKLTKFFEIEKEKTRSFLLEYLNFGGYPRVVLEETVEEKRAIIDEIYRSYLEKDVFYLLKIEKTEAFSNLIKLLADQIGRLINYSELSSILGISFHTLKQYLWYLEKTFIVWKLTPFFRNVRKEISHLPIYYFCDLGLRNYALGIFGRVSKPSELGFLFQNFVFRLLKEKFHLSSEEIHFWRTKEKAEVDFVLEKGREIIPIEVKYKELKKPKIERSLRSFILKYQPKSAWIINLSLKEKVKLGKTQICFFPFYEMV